MRPFTYKGAKTREISFPLGGIGSGCIGLGGSGQLIDWEIFNRPAKGSRNGFSHFAVKAEEKGKLLDARVLNGDLPPPYSGTGTRKYSGFGFGVARETLCGLPHFQHTEFIGGFPLAEIKFRDPNFPGKVKLTAFNPFIPLNDLDSSLPAAFFIINIQNDSERAIDYTAAFSICNPARGCTTNRFQQTNGISELSMTGNMSSNNINYGDFSIATDAPDVCAQEYWHRGLWFENLDIYWKDFARCGGIRPRYYSTPGKADHGTLAVKCHIPSGMRASCRFVFTWNVPNCHNYWNENIKNASVRAAAKKKKWRNYYATIFADSSATGRYSIENWARLEQKTRLFRDTLFSSTLPPEVIDAVSANISILKTPTCLRLEDGSFYGWEGCGCETGCCEGSCTHVWNYAYALPFLFPTLERSMRELDYKHNLRPDGAMTFRLQLPLGSQNWVYRPCADGQFGGVLKTYREWKISGDTEWMHKLWPKVRRSIEFAWAPTNEDRWDLKKSGVLHGRQHHSLDMELFGPNAWLTGFYLAALKAGSEMADVVGDTESSSKYRKIFTRGQTWMNKHLFNGKYFIQRVRLDDLTLLTPFKTDTRVRENYWSNEYHQLKYQIGDGCGIDQVVAQWHADILGLGNIFYPTLTRKALRAIYDYNFHSSMRNVVNASRIYCMNDESGTMMFVWPKNKQKPIIPIPYSEETMHGFEYQAACHMIMNGMTPEGLSMVKSVRDRYDGERRNPWNEIECGSNYARSMASYALLNALSGFQFNMVKGMIGFHPLYFVRERFRCFWSLNSAWGYAAIWRTGFHLRVLHGKIAIKSVALDFASKSDNISATLQNRRVSCKRVGNKAVFSKPITIQAGVSLRIKSAIHYRSQKNTPRGKNN